MDIWGLDKQIRQFLTEDLGQGDITTDPVFSGESESTACFIAREPMIAAGMESVAVRVFQVLNPDISVEFAVADGASVSKDEKMLQMRGPTRDLLKGERVALNLVQRLCGIATLTKKYVDQVAGLNVRITDTRKTTPGLRMLEKYAVRVGGGYNHRFNLGDGVLLKDNHIAACGSITQAVAKVRKRTPHTIKIEVETDTLEQVRECLECDVDIIMLDNMTLEQMREAVSLIGGKALVEASGGVNLDTVHDIAATGVDIISVGRLTHSAPACDISMDI